MVEFDFVPLEDRSAVDEDRPLALRCHEEVPGVPEADGGLLAGHLGGGAFQRQVHVDGVVASASTHRDLETETDVSFGADVCVKICLTIYKA